MPEQKSLDKGLKVKLIAATQIDPDALRAIGYDPAEFEEDGLDTFGDYDADELAEAAGRLCYLSFNRPNPKTRENSDYLKHILDIGHTSVLAHGSATFYIDTSRSVLAEITRSRFLAFSVVSQRYVDVTGLGVHWPPALADLSELDRAYAEDLLLYAKTETDRAYAGLMQIFEKLPRKQAREAARAVLPGMTASPMIVTGNHRAWRDFIKQRWHEAADAEIRELAGELLKQLREIAPHTYSDIPDTPFSY